MAVENDIKAIVKEITGIPDDKLVGDANFIDDLGIESIMAVDIVAAIENKFNITIPEERYGEIDSVDSVSALISELI